MQDVDTGLVVIGVNYRKTALDIRNKFALTTERIKEIYSELPVNMPHDFFILSTCNRTEIYCITDSPQRLPDTFPVITNVSSTEVEEYTFLKKGDEAVQHLFHVASGLDSQILGDYEIIGQLKNAFALAKTHGVVSGFMEKLVNASLRSSRQVRNSTAISDGTTSVSYAVIQMLKQKLSGKPSQKICLMGLGKIGTLTLKNLRHYLPEHEVTVINRNEERAQQTSVDFGVDYSPLENQKDTLAKSDVLIVATGADHPIISKETVALTPVKLIFDLSVPSNVSQEVRNDESIEFYDIDGLASIVNQTLSERQKQVPQAEKIVEEHIEEFKDWIRRREVYKEKITN